jgi:dethiobiotin synthetase
VNLVDLPSPLWVLGTDTNVGKTHVAGHIARAWAALGPVTYRKPFQTGVSGPEDPAADAAAVAIPGVLTETWTTYKEPLSPWAAAQAEGRSLDLQEALAWCRRPVP